MNTYPHTKPTHIDWLGEIPSHWEIVRVKNIFRLIAEPAEKNNNLELLSVYCDIGVKPRKELEERGNRASTTDGYWLVQKGDIVVNKLLAWMGGIGLSEYDGVTSPAYDILRPHKKISGLYYHLLFRTPLMLSEFKRHSRGIMDMRLRLYFEELGNIKIPLPPLAEQTAIANYLDTKTAQIQKAVRLKQEQISLLKEYRQALINQTVTQGLNPNAPMKNSGIEWLGEIPSHWEVKKITHIFEKISSGTTPTAGMPIYYDNGEINWLQTGDLNDGMIYKTSKKITPKAMQDFSSLKMYSPNSLVIAMYGATIGKVGLLNIHSTTNQACCVLSDGKNLEIKYIFYFFQAFKRTIISMAYGGGQPNISQDLIKSLRICFPPLTEQTAIANYLDTKTAQIDTAITTYQAQIDKLNEYQKSLVNDVVTGKVSVV